MYFDMYKLQNFEIERFLSQHWQKKPCVIRGLFREFTDPVDEHELAGMAQEQDIDSRIISQQSEQWQVYHGPFEDFESVCKGQWTLLVQSVDQYIPEARQLLDAFDFIPHWRKDDLMVSFSVEGGGVGPHLDQYDVFIVQGKGTRRWQVGDIGNYDEIHPAAHLRQITGFETIIDEVLEPGDVLYVPPGFPHNGVALSECLNFSVGFRAPTQAELLSDFADFTLQSKAFAKRFSDPVLAPRQHPSSIQRDEIEKFRALMKESLDSAGFDQWLGIFLSKINNFEDEDAPLPEQYTASQIRQMLDEGICFCPALHIKPVVFPQDSETGQFYVDGIAFDFNEKHRDRLNELLNSEYWQTPENLSLKDNLFFSELLTKLVNAGCWYPA